MPNAFAEESIEMKANLSYVGLRVTNMESALRFYQEGLGMTLTERSRIEDTGGEVAYLVSANGGPKLELNWYPKKSPHAAPYVVGEALDHLGFAVEGDIAAFVKRLETAGGKFRQEGPMKGLVYVDSPDGHTIELWKA
jgi:catechol 2,3-dioxygenase-like lactoylglutathione lyase family enzyme